MQSQVVMQREKRVKRKVSEKTPPSLRGLSVAHTTCLHAVNASHRIAAACSIITTRILSVRTPQYTLLMK
jgi:hypothetical protein